MAYDDHLFTAAGCNLILYHDNLEADDCIALTVKHIRKKFPDANSWIIASDMDYLQIASDKVQIFTLKFKNLQDSKKSFKVMEFLLCLKNVVLKPQKNYGMIGIYFIRNWNNRQNVMTFISETVKLLILIIYQPFYNNLLIINMVLSKGNPILEFQ